MTASQAAGKLDGYKTSHRKVKQTLASESDTLLTLLYVVPLLLCPGAFSKRASQEFDGGRHAE